MSRRAREAAGRRAENAAALLLQLKGYRILARRYQGPGGEVDMIAVWPLLGPAQVVAIIEVKQRSDEAALAEAISPAQRRRIEAGARGFLAGKPALAEAALRFDAVYVTPGSFPRHVKNLWQEGG